VQAPTPVPGVASSSHTVGGSGDSCTVLAEAIDKLDKLTTYSMKAPCLLPGAMQRPSKREEADEIGWVRNATSTAARQV
jgi:hypothetical protein